MTDDDRFESIRPKHPDFDALSASVRGMDELIESVGPSFDFNALTEYYVDPKSLGYLALQRAMRAFGVETVAELQEQQSFVQRGASLYMEAFLLGAGFQEDRMKEQSGV
jgi:hypothetical protein